jgi:hypothetical protein
MGMSIGETEGEEPRDRRQNWRIHRLSHSMASQSRRGALRKGRMAGMAKMKKIEEETPEGALVTAAKTIGAAAGKIAAAVGVSTPAKPKVPKLAKKHKSRLPRKQKKAAKKAMKSAKTSH